MWRFALLSALSLTLALSASSAAFTTDTAPDSDGNISVAVTDGATPSPTPPPGTPSSPGSITPARPGVSGGSGSVGGSGGGAVDAPADAGEISNDGVLYVGGINSAVTLSADPRAGSVKMWFTVRNASSSTIDATADFTLSGKVFGNSIDSVEAVPITGLAAGETRVVSAELHGAGQWTLLDARVTLTPGDTVDGVAQLPVSRDGMVFVFPWLLVVAVGGGVTTFFVLRAVRLTTGVRAAEVATA